MHQKVLSITLVTVICVPWVASARALYSSEPFPDGSIETRLLPMRTEARALILFGSDAASRLPKFAPVTSSETAKRNRLLKAQRGDRWTSFDKVQHAAFSLLMMLSGQYLLVNKAGWSESKSLPASIVATAGAVMGKEVYDWRVGPSRHFSVKDLVADGLGITVATVIIAF